LSDPQTHIRRRFTMLCLRCDRPVLVWDKWIGREVRCPHCSSTLQVPIPPPDDSPVRANPPSMAPRRAFNFACPRCGALLESHTGMCGQNARCPTCAAQLVVPFVNPRSGMPDRAQLLETEVTDPTPLHAYAASGHQAPRIIHHGDDEPVIECPRCNAHSPMDADSCNACGAPFTLEGAQTMQKLRFTRESIAALVLGLIALPLAPIFIPGMIAVALAWRSIRDSAGMRAPPLAIAGLILGTISLAGGVVWWWV
jgi:DNA-directed RNA polymerase subunit RPC12/RpoP